MHLLMQLKRWLQNSTRIEVTIPYTSIKEQKRERILLINYGSRWDGM